MQLLVDLVLAATGVATVIASARRGAISAVAALVGWVLGFWIGLQLAPAIIGAIDAVGALRPWQRNVAALVVVLLVALVCAIIVMSIGNIVRRAIRPLPVAGGLDAVLGAVFGALSWAVVVWLAAGFITSTGFRPAAQLADSSRIVAALDSYAPVTASRVFGAVGEAIESAGLPQVFASGGQEAIPRIQAPPADVPAAVSAASPSIVEVVSDEPRCGTVSSGSGWVVAPGRVVTNAHVVAGSSSTAVLVDGKSRRLAATVVGYDPETDVAVLAVPQLAAKPLPLDATGQPDGAAVFAAGYPGGGAYTIAPGRVRATMSAVGKDIYGDKNVTREIYSLRTDVEPGDSGGPLLDATGKVAGVVFERSTTDPETGYALTLKQVQPMIAQAPKLSAPVSTGACTPD